MNDQEGLAIAIEEAKTSYKEGGVPVRSPTLLFTSLHVRIQCRTRSTLISKLRMLCDGHLYGLTSSLESKVRKQTRGQGFACRTDLKIWQTQMSSHFYFDCILGMLI